jgi:hypothetical protein
VGEAVTPALWWWQQMLRDRRPCTCALGPGSTTIMECAQHGRSGIGRAEAEVIRRAKG